MAGLDYLKREYMQQDSVLIYDLIFLENKLLTLSFLFLLQIKHMALQLAHLSSYLFSL